MYSDTDEESDCIEWVLCLCNMFYTPLVRVQFLETIGYETHCGKCTLDDIHPESL